MKKAVRVLRKTVKWGLISLGCLFVLLCVVGVVLDAATPKGEANQQNTTQQREEITASAIYNLVNDERQKAGVARLSQNPLATQAAQQKCDDMVANNYYDHVNPTTGKHGYQYAIDLIQDGVWFNENLNQGDLATNREFIDSWLNSPAHKANMLDPRWTDTGVAVCKIPSESDSSRTIVQEFIEVKQQSQVQSSPSTMRTPVNCTTKHTPDVYGFGGEVIYRGSSYTSCY